MILVLFHVLYLVGKYVYNNYHIKKRKITSNQARNVETPRIVSEEVYNMIDAEAPQDYEMTNIIRFFPPAYIQRYTAVSDIFLSNKYKGKIRKVVDFGCADLSFFTYLKNIDGIEEILCVDIDRALLEANKEITVPLISEYIYCRAKPLVVHVCEGSVASSDRRLEKTDAVICIELIEHLYPDTLTDFPFNIFGYIKPKVAIITTPNADFNVLFPKFTGFRHPDHKFEWTREQFQDWAHNIVLRYPNYQVTFHGICNGPEGTEHLGACTQMAIFHRYDEEHDDIIGTKLLGTEGLFKVIASQEYPFKVDNRSDEQKILDEALYYIRRLSFQVEDLQEELPLERLLPLLNKFNVTMESLRTILEDAGWAIVNNERGPTVLIPQPSTFSDYSAIEDNFLDEDRWNEESEPPIDYYNEYTNQDLTFNDTWTSETWDEEPSIVIPRSNSIVQEGNSYLFDAEHECLSVNRLSDSVNIRELSTDLSSNSILQSTALPFTRNTLSDNDTATSSSAHDDNNSFIITKQVNRTLDFHHYMSVSHSSISPQPLSIHLDRVNSSYHDDTILTDKNMSCELSLMNNTFHSLNTLRDKDLDEATTSYFIHLNTSMHEQISCTGDQSSHENETIDCLEANIEDCKQTAATENICCEDHFSVEEHPFPLSTNKSTMKSHPRYTSSPRVLIKNKKINFNCKQFKHEKDISNNDISNTPQPADQLSSCADNNVLSICHSTSESVDNTKESKKKLPFLNKDSSFSSYQNIENTSNEENSLTPSQLTHVHNTNRSNTENCCYFLCAKKNSNSESNDHTLKSEEKENISNIQSETCVMKVSTECKDHSNSFNSKCNMSPSNVAEANKNMEIKPNSPELLETPPNSLSPEIMDSGYPNSASAQDMTPEYDLSSIAHDQIPDSESPSVAEAPQPANLEPIEVENGDLANNNRDGEGNNMVALIDNDMENLQPFINVLENDIENENDIYVVENGFPMWLLRILEMANPIDIDRHILRDHRELLPFDQVVGIDHDEGFSSSSSEEDSNENIDEIPNNVMDENYIDNDNEIMQDTDSEDDNNVASVFVPMPNSTSHADSDEWIVENT
ncbi:hypothetical protein KPH14_007050 [Odynerus spinipes]|uniref:Small RNA 2'-O-methyltransferase n=1 Tax=Odynerus spinipes TaxID=1348599 RepID=A0AAD9VSR0_9HYME|nr:hypothetical protein KPH14_007050 [Odynerus spinipes]